MYMLVSNNGNEDNALSACLVNMIDSEERHSQENLTLELWLSDLKHVMD